jgi:hypothetical protein
MPLPWLRILDAVIGVTDLARSRRIRTMADDQQQLETTGRPPAAFETRLAGVVVAALKEAFDRDAHRLDLEREQLAAERARAERALRLELQRQAADREIGRLRLLAGVAVATWIGTLFFSSRLIGGAIGARVMLGAGWLLLLGSLAMALTAQSRVAASLDAFSRDEGAVPGRSVSSGAGGALAPWLIVAGLALVGAAVLMA